MELPRRKKNRLAGYDYSQAGYYFITICVKNKQPLLGKIDVGARIARPCDNAVILSDAGKIVDIAIQNINEIYPSVVVDKYVIMPNHIHLILILHNHNGRAMRAPTVSTVMNQLKGYITKQLGYSIWQKLFHDHIIRNKEEYQKIWAYIDTNPQKWQEDCYHTA